MNCRSLIESHSILRQLSNLKSTMEGNDEIEGAVSCESLAILASLAIGTLAIGGPFLRV